MLQKITDNIWFTPYSRETDRPNLGYIKGEKCSVMVDAGTSPAHVEMFLDALKEQGLSSPDMVFVTHQHWDHTFGMSALEGVTSIAGRKTNDILKKLSESNDMPGNEKMSFFFSGLVPEFCRPHIEIEYPCLDDIKVKTADITFDGEMRIDIGGETLLLRHIVSGHTDDNYCLLCEKSKVLFFGDANSEEVVGTDWIDHPVPLAAQIEELEKMDFSLCLTGHVPLYTKEELLANLRERLAACTEQG